MNQLSTGQIFSLIFVIGLAIGSLTTIGMYSIKPQTIEERCVEFSKKTCEPRVGDENMFCQGINYAFCLEGGGDTNTQKYQDDMKSVH